MLTPIGFRSGFPMLLVIGSIGVVHAQVNFHYCQLVDNRQISSVGKVELSINPNEPLQSGQTYQVTVDVQGEFDSSNIVAVHSAVSWPDSAPVSKHQGIGYQRKLCATLHSKVDQRPASRISFAWTAPPEDMGCVDFVATFKLGESFLLQNERIHRICPSPDRLAKERIVFTGLNQEGVVFREDFESGLLNETIWSSHAGVFTSNNSCGSNHDRLSAVFCPSHRVDVDSKEPTHLTSTPIDLSDGGALQFAIGRTACNERFTKESNANATVSFGLGCANWTFSQNFSLPKSRDAPVHVIPLTANLRRPNTCLRFSASASTDCFDIDDVIVTRSSDRPSSLHADFDPFNASDWIFFPGGSVHSACQGSNGHSLVFNATQRNNWATTRDLQLYSVPSNEHVLWKADFDAILPADHWDYFNASFNDNCAGDGRLLLLHPVSLTNTNGSACTPKLDLSAAGNLRFRMEYWTNPPCSNQSAVKKSPPAKLNVWIKRSNHMSERPSLLSTFNLKREPISASLVLPMDWQVTDAKICWQLMTESADTWPSWTLEDIVLLPTFPHPFELTLQFRLQLACHLSPAQVDVAKGDEVAVQAQYSTDQGRQWNPLHSLCLPPTCAGAHSALQTAWTSLDVVRPWERITLPLPFSSMSDHMRIRFVQKGRGGTECWALDDIHIASCWLGCHGHGTCVEGNRCICDEGYSGQWCETPVLALPTFLRENFEREESRQRFYQLSGMELDDRCGTVAAGLSAVFDQAGTRQLVTFDMDTVDSRVFQFALKMGGPRSYKHCPGPDRAIESLYVHSSCNGGVTWTLQSVIHPENTGTQFVRVDLTSDAVGTSCRFKLWQPHHSGAGLDVWAVDDLYVGPSLSESLGHNSFTGQTAFVGRHPLEDFCNRSRVMVLQPNELEETQPVWIESFSVVQVELVVGCGANQPLNTNNTLTVQFSVDGGVDWKDLVRRHVSEVQIWTRITLELPPESWSEATRFRIAQTGRSFEQSPSAVDYFYAGPNECPDLCRGNGRCSLNGCACDRGFYGRNCLPAISSLEPFVLNGGRFTTSDLDGCFIHGARNIVFDGPGTRVLETKEMEHSAGASVHFIIRLGDCEGESKRRAQIQVVLQVSWNGGLEWTPLREYRSPFDAVPRFEQVPVGGSPFSFFKVRLIQTGVHGSGNNVWSVAGLGAFVSPTDVGQLDRPLEDNNDLWLIKNIADPKSFCLAFDSHCPIRIQWYGAVTKPVSLELGDSIQFSVAIEQTGGSQSGAHESLVFEYSVDGGKRWNLARPDCANAWSNCRGAHQPSRIDYRTIDTDTRWHYDVTKEMADRSVVLRWMHQRHPDIQEAIRGFKLRDLYIGPPCPALCSGHGHCWKGSCSCDSGYSGEDCSVFWHSKLAGFYDTFIDKELQHHWNRVIGGRVVPNYCHGDDNTVLFFGNKGPRLAQTVELDAQNIRMVQFTLGSSNFPVFKKNCRHLLSEFLPNEDTLNSAIVLDYSVNNGLTWNYLDSWPFDGYNEKRLEAILPPSARTPATVFRWWQKDYSSANSIAPSWYLDNVLVNLNDTNPTSFEHETAEAQQDESAIGQGNWLGWQGLMSKKPLNSLDGPFDDSSSWSAYVETWDIDITDSTFAQFELLIPTNGETAEIRFEFSTDMGRRWYLVEEACHHQAGQLCDNLHPPSIYVLTSENNATRITVQLPKHIVSRSTRFRWLSRAQRETGAPVWGVGHVYVGGTCPWMCSGHGTCHMGLCRCDDGFGNLDCVSVVPLPKSFVEHFDETGTRRNIAGGSISSGCGVLTSGTAAFFHHGGLRFFQTPDLDLTSASYAQLAVKFNCETEETEDMADSSGQRLLLQYSVNGGISWNLIQEVKGKEEQEFQTIVVNLMRIPDLTNSTRIRLWQPIHAGEGRDTWAVDGLTIQNLLPELPPLTGTFDEFESSDRWLVWFGGQVEAYCAKENALVFTGQLGENQLFTRDLVITSETILQFELNVGCGTNDPDFPVRLEYSINGGLEWHLVVPGDIQRQNLHAIWPIQSSTVFYATSSQWRRETVLLSHLEPHRTIRFRWYQGYLNETNKSLAPHWAIRNVFLGPQCPELCNGHGACTEMGVCACDQDHTGETCQSPSVPNPRDFHESFDAQPSLDVHWLRMIGGAPSDYSEEVGFGRRLVMDRSGTRLMESRDLDLTNANFLQFYLELFPSSVDSSDDEAIMVAYSINGGIQWTPFKWIALNDALVNELHQLKLPEQALNPAARLRWFQVGQGKEGINIWSVDEIYIGGESYAKRSIQDDFSSNRWTQANWLFVSGAKLEPSCNSENLTLHLAGRAGVVAMTKDVAAVDGTHLQYEMSTECDEPNACKRMRLEYSYNLGVTWHSLPEECVRGSEGQECRSFSLHSELLSRATGYRRFVTVLLPVISGVVRIRWTGDEHFHHGWSLHWVYVGAGCSDGCNGRGRCVADSCRCMSNWTGERCEVPRAPLLSSVREYFINQPNDEVWHRVAGAVVAHSCGTLDSGPSLVFNGACDRYAETRELDFRHVNVVQFHLRAGCAHSESPSDANRILFQFSLNGGVHWHPALTLSLSHFGDPQLVSYVLPDHAQVTGVKLRWWQLSGPNSMDGWAIDSLVIDRPINVSGSAEEGYQMDAPGLISAQQAVRPLDAIFGQRLWWRRVNGGHVDSLCGRRGDILRCRSTAMENSLLETADFILPAEGQQVSFDLLVGDCRNEESELSGVIKPAILLEVSVDHGLSWRLLQPLKLRGEANGPQIPSVYYETHEWQTYRYSLRDLSGNRFARFRWRQGKSSFAEPWAVSNLTTSLLVPAFGKVGLPFLREDFNSAKTVWSQWSLLSGGRILGSSERLGDGGAAFFNGPGLRVLQTVALDLTFAETLQFIMQFPRKKGRPSDGESCLNVVYLQCSSNSGTDWVLVQEYHPSPDSTSKLMYERVPATCQHSEALLRWWQPLNLSESGNVQSKPHWAVDNVIVEYSNHRMDEIQDSFRETTLNHRVWQFSPNGVISDHFCGERNATSIHFVSGTDSDWIGITSRHVTVKESYAAYFQIKTSCKDNACPSANGNKSRIHFEARHGHGPPTWTLVRPNCLPSHNSTHCESNMFHSPSSYPLNGLSDWRRIVIPLTTSFVSKTWQFRWIAKNLERGETSPWAIRNVYIGRRCPSHCHGHGDCIQGRCHCDKGYEGSTCFARLATSTHSPPLSDHFDGGLSAMWQLVTGGNVQVGCGTLMPLAHGKHLYFSGCGERMAVTVGYSTASVRRLAFVIRIGTPQQSPTCRVQPIGSKNSLSLDRGVLLQYSSNGVDWHWLATHNLFDFAQPKRVMYTVPYTKAGPQTVQFRWWQPSHGGAMWDQWALDNIEMLS